MDLVSILPWDDDTVINWFKVSETHLDMSISSCLVGGHILFHLSINTLLGCYSMSYQSPFSNPLVLLTM